MDFLNLSSQWIYGGLKWNIEINRRFAEPKYLEPYGYKVYSQNDEDGIIEEIFKRIGVTNRQFVEFGVENGTENNTRFLLMQDWKGLWIEGNRDHCEEIQSDFFDEVKEGKLQITNAFITKDNINQIIQDACLDEEIDLLSIDIDGNDYHVWKAIDVIKPRVVVIEYNAKFPPEFYWVMRYEEKHTWDGTDYFGASLKALEQLGKEKGFILVGTNFCGTNAFFVKEDLINDKFIIGGSEKVYNPARYNIYHYPGHGPKKGKDYEKLDKSDMKAVLECQMTSIEVKENEVVKISVRIINKGTMVLKSQQPYPVHLSYHIYDEKGNMIVYDGERTLLSKPILPGAGLEQAIVVNTRGLKTGVYHLKIDLVQESVFWFSDVGEVLSDMLMVKISERI